MLWHYYDFTSRKTEADEKIAKRLKERKECVCVWCAQTTRALSIRGGLDESIQSFQHK